MNELEIWLYLTNKFVSENAIMYEHVTGTEVLRTWVGAWIPEQGHVELALHDPKIVLDLMNQNPHLLKESYEAWLDGADNVAGAFCEALYQQEQDIDQFDSIINPFKDFSDLITKWFEVYPIDESIESEYPEALSLFNSLDK